MNHLFDLMIDRRHTNSLKWNVEEQDLAMWVADMDFPTAPCVQQALAHIVEFGVFGYSDIPAEYFTSYHNWWKKRHYFNIPKEWMMFSSGVVPAISSIIRRLTLPAENILVLSPVYNIFYHSILNNGRQVLSSDLIYEQGTYHIDFVDLEKKLQDPQTSMMILCNPHNPLGKIWSKTELQRIGALCEQYHVIAVSDEIHCDLTEPGKTYHPFASINEQCANNSISCLSASKAFNLAGLQAACIVVPDEKLRHRVWRGLNTDEVAEPNIFACEAVISAFNNGEAWLEEARSYISKNKQMARAYIEQYLPQLSLIDGQATYLLWIDCSALHPFVDRFCAYLHQEKHLLISNGSAFGENGENFIRMNIACPKERMMDGLRRLAEGVTEFTVLYLNE